MLAKSAFHPAPLATRFAIADRLHGVDKRVHFPGGFHFVLVIWCKNRLTARGSEPGFYIKSFSLACSDQAAVLTAGTDSAAAFADL